MALGLAALKQQKEEIAQAERDRNKPRAGWFTPPADGTAVKIQFLQELDPDAKLYNPAHGTYLTALEHQAPGKKGYLSRALDTIERDGRDWAQEQHLKDPKAGWGPKKFFYINVAVEEEGEIVPKIIQRKLSNQFVADLIEIYEDSDFEGITGKVFAIKRVGEGTSTQWRIKELKNETMDVSGVEPWDLEEHAVKYIPYEKQQEFYMRNATLPDGTQPSSGGFGGKTQPASVTQPKEDEGDWGW